MATSRIGAMTTIKDDNGQSVSLREYVETMFHERDRFYELRAKAAADNLETARHELEYRLHTLNELRQVVIDDRTLFVHADAYEARRAIFDTWQDNIDRAITTIQTRSAVWTAAIGFGFLILQLALHFFLGGGWALTPR